MFIVNFQTVLKRRNELENKKPEVNPDTLREEFTAAGLLGIAALVEYLAKSDCSELRPSFFDDPDNHSREIINAVAAQYGITFDDWTKGPLSGFRDQKDPAAALSLGITIGPIHTGLGRKIDLTPLEWLTTLYAVRANISPKALELFDRVCAQTTETILRPGEPIDLKNL